MCNRLIICAIFFSGLILGCEKSPLHKSTRVMLGTFVEVISDDKLASQVVFNEIKRIEKLLSKYDPQSEVSRLNQYESLAVSPETFYIIEQAKYFWQISSGAFDITVGPLLDLWGFSDKKYHKPTQAEVERMLRLVGSDKIIIDKNKNTVELKIPGMKLDLGAIAKGYAVDCAVKRLKEQGIKNCLINAGGQIYCLGTKYGKPWRVAIRNPRKDSLLDNLELRNTAVSTSGDYEQYFIIEKKRYSHIMNPKTGYPAASGVTSVTVIASSGLTADALATAIFVLGKERGLELAAKFPKVTVKIIEEDDKQN
ncbi:MAG: FAD:protein FMN transferase [bacterium]